MIIWRPLTNLIVCQLSPLLLPRRISFSMKGFTENPRLVTLFTLKKTELLLLETHYKLKDVSGAKKADIRRALTECLVDKNIVWKKKKA